MTVTSESGVAAGASAPASASARVRLAVAACTGLALALGFAHLRRRSLWQDEAFTWSTVDRDFPGVVSLVARREGYQILHSFIEWPTNRISSTVAALRTPSVLAFGAAVPAVWLAGRRLFDERTGLLAALLFALNGFALQYAQEARSYMLATALCAYSGAFLAQHVLAPRRWSRAAWIGFSALAIYAHGFAALAVGSQVLALWFLPVARRRELRWVRDGFLIALFAAPALLAPLIQIGNGEIGFISKPGLGSLRGLVWSMSGRTVTAIPAIGLGVAVALVVAVGVWRRSPHSTAAFCFAVPVLWTVLPSLLLLLVSLVHPIWLERYVLWSVVGVVLLAAYGLMRLTRERVVVTAIVVLVTVALATRGVVEWYKAAPYQDYHSAMTQLGARARAGDAIVFTPDEVRLPSEFYLRTTSDLHELKPVFPSQTWG
ncbi:MAG: mannosyltransferase, partial [Actinomycetota bacterium]|nr:mannosyltransferase [Actinomycetota bacterium]